MDETLDTLFVNLNPQEFGALYQPSKQDYEDSKLLDTQASLKETADKEALKRFDPFAEPSPFKPVPSIGETVIEDMVTHPSSTAEGIGEALLPVMNPMGWIPAMADAITIARDYTKGTTLDKYLPKMGSPYEFLRYMDENPGDWRHLIGVNSKLQDMIANPEDYAE